MTDTNSIPPLPQNDQPAQNGEDTEALRRIQRDIQQEIFRRHIIRQIGDTVHTPPATENGDDEPASDEDEKKENGALAAWLGLTKEGDAVEAMIAAQLVATHELAMAVMGRAITRTHQSGHFGAYITDACRAANATLRQIETLARYRTWRLKDDQSQDAQATNGQFPLR
ncbi:MAG: hypothetical protein GKS03_09165 [Alphaproteobacteria bacterium]|nr:hypothetical protein [Alphaproteobacteria bacterium]